MSALSIRHVLLATDFSAASSRARELAVDLALRSEAKLTVLHVLVPMGYPYWIPQLDSVRANAEREMQAYIERLRARVPGVLGVVRECAPSIEIADAARELSADVVVMGTHGRAGVRHAWMGSVAEKVVHACTVPVLTATSWRFEDLRDAARRLAPMLTLPPRAVLVGVGRAGAMLAAHLGAEKAATADALLVTPLLVDRDTSGLVAEDGTTLLHSWASLRPESIPGNAHEIVAAEASTLRNGCGRAPVTGRSAIVVCERVDPLAVELAADVLRKNGAIEVRAAIAVADAETIEAVKKMVDDVVVAEIVSGKDEIDCAYRDATQPTLGGLRKHLLATRTRDAAAAVYGSG